MKRMKAALEEQRLKGSRRIDLDWETYMSWRDLVELSRVWWYFPKVLF